MPPPSNSIPSPLADLIAHRLRVLGQPTRIKLIDSLREGAVSVRELTESVGGVQQNISQHLAILHQAGIVGRRKDGTRVLYELIDPHVLALLDQAQASQTHHLEALSRLIETREE